MKTTWALVADEAIARILEKPTGADLEPVEELTDRIGMLEGEIARLRAAIDSKRKSKSAADAFFKI